MPVYALAARHRAGGSGRGDALHPRRAGDDRADDRARWRAASRLGTAEAERRGRVMCGLSSVSLGDIMSRISLRFVMGLGRAPKVVHIACDLTMTSCCLS